MEDVIFYVIIDTFHSTTCIVSYQLDISRGYYFGDIWMISSCNVMFNFGTNMENVTHLKNRTLLYYGAFKCGPASEPLARH